MSINDNMMGKSGTIMEAMGSERRCDFPTDPTNRRCFLCLINLEPKHLGSLPSSTSHLFHYLSLTHYLEANRNWEVLYDNGKVTLSSPLSTTERENHELKVPMCVPCAVVNERFLELHGQLKKIEMEVISCLGIIYDKMATAGQIQRPLKEAFGDHNGPDNGMRKDVMQKCSQKLCHMLPSVNLTRLPDANCRSADSTSNIVTSIIKIEAVPDHNEDAHHDDGDQDDYDGATTEINNPEFLTAENSPSRPSPGDSDNGADSENNDDPDKDYWNDSSDDPASPKSNIDIEEGAEREEIETINYPLEIISSVEPTKNAGKHRRSKVTHKYKCKICLKVFGRKEHFERHYRNLHFQHEFKCPHCPRSFPINSQLAEHRRKKHPAGAQPPMSKPTFDPTTGRFTCTLCPKDFKKERYIYDHFKRAHLKLKYSCGECGKTFSDQKHLKHHQKNIHQGLRFPCQACNKSFTMKNTLKLHLRRTPCGKGMGLQPPPPREICHICGKDLRDKSKLQQHLVGVHSQVRTHLCELCGKKFKNKCHLRIHKEGVHEGKKVNAPSTSKSR